MGTTQGQAGSLHDVFGGNDYINFFIDVANVRNRNKERFERSLDLGFILYVFYSISYIPQLFPNSYFKLFQIVGSTIL